MAVKIILKKVQKATDFEKKMTPKNLSTGAEAKAVSCTSLSAIFFLKAQHRCRIGIETKNICLVGFF